MSLAMRHIKYEITIEYRKEVICMGLLDAIFGNNQPPKINSILPTAAKNEICAGRIEHGELVQHRGILYVTNQRIVFQAFEKGFDKTYRYLTAVTPYVDACELQFGSKTYNMYVDDGNLLYEVLQLVKQRRQIP